MATKLFLRNTHNNGIGATYYDMLLTAGAAADTAVVNTVASSTEIQFTKTAGGSLVNFVTPPLAAGFTLTSTDISAWMHENNAQANATGRFRVFKRTAAGVETELGGGPFNRTGEFGTAAAELTWTGNVTDTAFAADDRILLKPYITNSGTMGGGRQCTLTFNAADGATGDSFFNLAETVTFKAEAATGTLAVTEAADGASINGTAQWLAALAANETADGADFDGSVTTPATGTLAVTEAADSADFDGDVASATIDGDLAASEPRDTAALTGTAVWLATLAASEARDTASFAGQAVWFATLAASEAQDTALFSGDVIVLPSGTLDATEAPDVALFSVDVELGAIEGVLAASEAADVASFLPPLIPPPTDPSMLRGPLTFGWPKAYAPRGW